ncbi:MAG TPA: hypothetical protein DEB17_04960 [Chlorobaculum sp.]|uniref:Uncharacterized protein n=1 Tax=Chlorobaculum tepidum (strain ATCC 49652 / DSM 12025 / NBRC 103806 / TLS) TaxID=194439 RepID=Q8KAZ5_CHLTE|nr:hypothetical protein CT2003 [Chlorobaculum tepidum TLS]HBU23335.1 hypothetical protein [Chlorobaculum sp.]
MDRHPEIVTRERVNKTKKSGPMMNSGRSFFMKSGQS